MNRYVLTRWGRQAAVGDTGTAYAYPVIVATCSDEANAEKIVEALNAYEPTWQEGQQRV